jgi:hypothetical protein
LKEPLKEEEDNEIKEIMTLSNAVVELQPIIQTIIQYNIPKNCIVELLQMICIIYRYIIFSI